MNIVWFTWKDTDHPLAGGAEVVNEELAARLARDGHRVTFLTAAWPGAKPTATRHGFMVIRTGSRYTSYVTAARYYRRHRAELGPDLVIDECNTMPYFAGLYSGVRTVLFFHMLCRRIWFYEFPFPLSLIGYLAEPVYLRLLRPRREVITVSESTRQDLRRQGFQHEAIQLISEGSNVPPVPSLAALTKYPHPTILSHGSVRPMKRTLDQIKAFELAKTRLPNLKFKLSGDTSGPYGRRVLACIRASPHAADIEVLGRTTDEQKMELMQRCHLISVTSVKEGWGLIVTEAASQGTPAVVYDVDGLRDAVRHDQTGLVTPPRPADLADAMVAALSDPARYQQLRTAAWEWSKTITFDRSYADFCRALQLNT
jgi:glycosyltransferase involved in cell wall biosynthesis